jgi:multidrug efflux pump subunit AcrB
MGTLQKKEFISMGTKKNAEKHLINEKDEKVFSEIVSDYEKTALAAFSIKNPYLMIVLCMVVVLLGFLAIFTMPKDLLPASKQPAVQILSLYPGMAAENIETNLTYKFERFTGQATGLIRQESKSVSGVSLVRNYFDEKSTDQNSAISNTVALSMSVLRRLPPGAQPPIILPFDPMGAMPLTLVAVSGDFPINQIYDYAQYYVRRNIQSKPGAIAPTQLGGAEEQIIVKLNPEKMKKFNLSPVEIVDKISHLNTFIPGGDVKIGINDYQVYTNGIANSVEDINNFPIRSQEGIHVYLKDVGNAEKSNIRQTNIVTIDGKEQVYVPVFRQQGANSLQVVEDVRASMKALGNEIKGLSLTLVADQTVFIKKAIDSIAEEVLIGGGLAALMVFLFLGNPRATFATLLSLPLSAFFVFMGLKALGQTINIMTLGGIALSVGLLVDNSIVAIENIMRHIREDSNPNRIAVVIKGADEVMIPIISVTLCIVAVLLPLIFTTGVINVLFGAVAKTAILAIMGSLFSQITVIPLFSAHFLARYDNTPPKIFQSIQNGLLKFSEFYARQLAKVFIRPKIVLTAILVLLTIGILLSAHIGTELFPRADAGNMTLEVRFQSGLRIEETKNRSIVIEKRIREIIPSSDLKMVIADMGVYNGYPAAFSNNAGSQDVTMTIELTENRKHTTQYYARKLRKEIPKVFPDVDMGIQLGGMLTSAINGGMKAPIDIQVEGKDWSIAHQLAKDLVEKIKLVKGAVDVRIQERLDAPSYKVTIDRTKADEQGIYMDEVVENIVSSVTGSITYKPIVWIDPATGIDYFMGVRVPQKKLTQFNDFSTLPITGFSQPRTVPLNSLAKIDNSKTVTEINRVNMKRVINVYLDAEDRDVGGLSKEVQGIIDRAKKPENYKIEMRGEIKMMNETFFQLAGGFLLSIILVYMILVVQFKSFSIPLIMLLTVPLGIFGVALMFVLTNTYFSIQAGIGVIFLIGIAVSNGVLLIEFIIHKQEHDHMPVDEAILEGAKARLRPILMTSLASILGLAPMAIGFGKGSESNIPLGRAVIGGQFFSVILTLFVLPTFYRILHNRFLKGSKEALKNA